MRLVLDQARCQGHNRCRLLAPDLFEADEMGQAVLLVHGPVPPDLLDQALLAEANCPEFAIRVMDEPDGG